MKILRLVIFFLILFLLLRFGLVFRQLNCSVLGATLESGVCEQINARFHGRSLFLTDLENDQIWSDLLANGEYSQVYQYQSIKKSLSGQAELTLLAKLPDYRLIIGQNRYLLNQNNKLKNDQAKLTLTSIEFSGDPAIVSQGYLDEQYHQKFLALSTALRKYQIEVSRIVWVSDQEIHLSLAQTPSVQLEVVLDDSRDFDYQLERLALVLNQKDLPTILQGKKMLDLRFNLPVLR